MNTTEANTHGVPIYIIAKATEVAMRSKIRRDRAVQLLGLLLPLVFWFGAVTIPDVEKVFPFLTPLFSKTIFYPLSFVVSMCFVMIYMNDQDRNSDVQADKLETENYTVLRGNGEWWLVYKPDGRAYPLLSEPPELPFLQRAKAALIDR